MDSYFGMATVCKPGYAPNPKWRGKRGQRQCLKMKPAKITLKELQAIATANDVSIYKRRKDDMGFTKTPLTVRALKFRLTKMNVPYGSSANVTKAAQNLIDVDVPVVKAPLGGDGLGGLAFPRPKGFARFGMATVCLPGFSPNPKWKPGRGRRQCLKDGGLASRRVAGRSGKITLKQLQKIARANDVSIYKRRADDMGFTKTPLTEKALKYRLTKMRVPYK